VNVCTGWAKNGATDSTIILSILNRSKKISLEDSLVNLQLNGYQKSHRILHVATLPCEILMSEKQAINDKLQGSVATYLRFSGVAESASEKKSKLVNIWQRNKQERDCLMHFVRLANTLLKDGESARK